MRVAAPSAVRAAGPAHGVGAGASAGAGRGVPAVGGRPPALGQEVQDRTGQGQTQSHIMVNVFSIVVSVCYT